MLAVLAAGFLYFLQPPQALQHDASAHVKFIARGKVTPACEDLGAAPERTIEACTRGTLIVMPNPCRWPGRESYAELMCHELGHVSGWRHEADPRFPLKVPR